MTKLAIVTGTSGALGRAYLEKLYTIKGIKCFGISRKSTGKKLRGVSYAEKVDLLDAELVRKTIEKQAPLDSKQQVIFIHPVGKFKFEPNKKPEIDLDGDGIDDEVLESNVSTFGNIEEPLSRFVKQLSKVTNIVEVGFGSVSDKYKVPFWLSYSRSKDILRGEISGRARRNSHNIKVRGIFVNVSSVNTRNENNLRPNADRTYWLEPNEIVNDTLRLIIGDNQRDDHELRYVETDVFKPRPDFDPNVYYSEEVVLERWKREMG